jgi:hypothetical protein
MQADADLRLTYAHFLDLSRRVATGGHYAVAYHALMAALHCAEDAGDAARLAEVAGLLRQAKGVVDAIHPPHKLSTRAAHTGRSIFEMGAVEAEAAIRRLECEHRIEELRRMGVGTLGTGPSKPGVTDD